MRRAVQATAVAVVVALLGVLIWDTAHSATGKIARDVDNGKVVPAWQFTRPRVDARGCSASRR